VTNGQYVALAEDEDQCDGCSMIFLKAQADLVAHRGDRLCPRCRVVFRTAVTLFEQSITEEDVIIPTLIFARDAGDSAAYKELAMMGDPDKKCTPLSLAEIMHDAMGRVLLRKDQAYMGLYFVDVVEGVPLVRVAPFTVVGEEHPEMGLLEQVRVQILSRRVKPASIRTRYLQFLDERGSRWGKNSRACLSYEFCRNYLEITIKPPPGFFPPWREASGNPLDHPALHFPPPTIVEGFCEGLLRSLRGGEWGESVFELDSYGKPLGKTPEKIIPAFVAWHVGPAATGKIPAWARAEVSRILNKHLLRPCGKPELPEDRWGPDDTVWRDVEALRLRFQRLHGAGSVRPLPPMVS
jgi:hypothetical protein